MWGLLIGREEGRGRYGREGWCVSVDGGGLMVWSMVFGVWGLGVSEGWL